MTEKALFHSPSDLLAGAESLLEKDDPHFNRAAVLESISALEAYVGEIIFELLGSTLDPSLIELVKQKTKMDFDSRMSVLVPLATGQSVDKNSRLWQDYKECKKIRNKVTHMGSVVSHEEAKNTVRTVYDWLSFMGSTAEIDTSLLSLKKAIEREPERFSSYKTIEREICNYFGITKEAKSKIGEIYQFKDGSLAEADMVVEIGNKKVLIEYKTLHDRHTIDMQLEMATRHVRKLLYAEKFDKAAILFLCRKEIPKNYEMLMREMDGKISMIPIKLFNKRVN